MQRIDKGQGTDANSQQGNEQGAPLGTIPPSESPTDSPPHQQQQQLPPTQEERQADTNNNDSANNDDSTGEARDSAQQEANADTTLPPATGQAESATPTAPEPGVFTILSDLFRSVIAPHEPAGETEQERKESTHLFLHDLCQSAYQVVAPDNATDRLSRLQEVPAQFRESFRSVFSELLPTTTPAPMGPEATLQPPHQQEEQDSIMMEQAPPLETVTEEQEEASTTMMDVGRNKTTRSGTA